MNVGYDRKAPHLVAKRILKMRSEGNLLIRRYGETYFYVRTEGVCVAVLLMFNALYFVLDGIPFRVVLESGTHKLQTNKKCMYAHHVVTRMLSHHVNHATVNVHGAQYDIYFEDVL